MYNSSQKLISLPDLIFTTTRDPSTKNAESISKKKPQNKNVTRSDFATMQNTSLCKSQNAAQYSNMDLLPEPSYPLHLAGDNQAIDPAQIAHCLAEIPTSQSAAIPFTPRDPAITLKRI